MQFPVAFINNHRTMVILMTQNFSLITSKRHGNTWPVRFINNHCTMEILIPCSLVKGACILGQFLKKLPSLNVFTLNCTLFLVSTCGRTRQQCFDDLSTSSQTTIQKIFLLWIGSPNTKPGWRPYCYWSEKEAHSCHSRHRLLLMNGVSFYKTWLKRRQYIALFLQLLLLLLLQNRASLHKTWSKTIHCQSRKEPIHTIYDTTVTTTFFKLIENNTLLWLLFLFLLKASPDESTWSWTLHCKVYRLKELLESTSSKTSCMV